MADRATTRAGSISWLICLLLIVVAVPTAAQDRFCQNGNFIIDARYDGGNFARCKFRGSNKVELTIRKEDKQVVVEQPWFSFRITARQPGALQVKLKFPKAYARYWPKLSIDGSTWRRAADSSVSFLKKRRHMELTIDVDETGTWVSAQELLASAYYDEWLAELDAHDDFTVAKIGRTVNDRPIHLAKTANKPEVVILLGRQHPAEVPGAIAMRKFVDVVVGDTNLARAFRERFTLLIIPLLNPDGVARGHWRHNARKTDLNRDWGPFTQAETQSVAQLLAGLDKLNMRPRLMLDFHATRETPTMVFYTQTADDNTNPPLFASTWLGRVDERIDYYEFTHDPRSPSGLDNTKNYFFLRYGIPAITYEIGDTADRELVRKYTPIFAEEMMRTMLDSERPAPN